MRRRRRRAACCPGPAAFKLYDTYGLALEEQEEMAREAGLTIDREGFTAEMEKQRTRARASWKGAEKAQVNPVYQALPQDRIRRAARRWRLRATVVAVLDGRNRARPHAVLRRGGRAGGRHGRADFEGDRRNRGGGRIAPTRPRPARAFTR